MVALARRLQPHALIDVGNLVAFAAPILAA